jgi:trimeric autotransporter adhesin
MMRVTRRETPRVGRARWCTTTGGANTASGFAALFSNATGSNNTAAGASALSSNTTGNFNIAMGFEALVDNTEGNFNTASGHAALGRTTTGGANTASGAGALESNTTGNNNTALGVSADVTAGNLVNATALGAGARVNASNKIRLGNEAVTVIEGQVALTVVSDKTKKENFQPVDGEAVLEEIRGLALTSWNFIGHDPKAFRHYGPMAQDFFAAFGHDGIGQIGSATTINTGDMAGILLSAVQALATRTAELQQKEAQMAVLAAHVEALQAKLAAVETVVTRVEALEQRKHLAIQITAENRSMQQLPLSTAEATDEPKKGTP